VLFGAAVREYTSDSATAPAPSVTQSGRAGDVEVAESKIPGIPEDGNY
jgi:hypothetical protein